MRTPRPILLAAAVFGACACNGGDNPSFDEASHQFYEAYCARLLKCHQELRGEDQGTQDFLRSYPGGEEDCVEQNFDEFSSLRSLESSCSQERWNECAESMKTTTCVSSPCVGPVVPASCDGC